MTHSQTNTHKHYQQLSFSDRATIQALRASGDTATVIDYEPWVTHMTLVWQPEALHNPLVARFVGQLSGGESEKYSK